MGCGLQHGSDELCCRGHCCGFRIIVVYLGAEVPPNPMQSQMLSSSPVQCVRGYMEAKQLFFSLTASNPLKGMRPSLSFQGGMIKAVYNMHTRYNKPLGKKAEKYVKKCGVNSKFSFFPNAQCPLLKMQITF